jgi:hypothetical protein
MTFLPGRHDAAIADDASQELLLLRNINEVAFRFPVFAFSGNPRPFSGVASSDDGQTILIAQLGSDDITMINLASRIVTVVACQCSPTGINRMKGPDLFRLNGLTGGPITILNASLDNHPHISIIPTGLPETLRGGRESQ